MSQLPASLDVVLNELRLRLYRAARGRDVPKIERLGALIEGLSSEFGRHDGSVGDA